MLRGFGLRRLLGGSLAEALGLGPRGVGFGAALLRERVRGVGLLLRGLPRVLGLARERLRALALGLDAREIFRAHRLRRGIACGDHDDHFVVGRRDVVAAGPRERDDDANRAVIELLRGDRRDRPRARRERRRALVSFERVGEPGPRQIDDDAARTIRACTR